MRHRRLHRRSLPLAGSPAKALTATTTPPPSSTPSARLLSAKVPLAQRLTAPPSGLRQQPPHDLHRLAVLEIENERPGGVANPDVAIGPSECTYLGHG
jgi:hypothetical protein